MARDGVLVVVSEGRVEVSDFERRPDPTPEEIEAECEKIREGWRELKKGKMQEPKRGHRMYTFERRRGSFYCYVSGEYM